MPNYTTKKQPKEPPAFAVWDIKNQYWYFLDSNELNFSFIPTRGYILLEGNVTQVTKSNNTELEARAKKVTELLNELKKYV